MPTETIKIGFKTRGKKPMNDAMPRFFVVLGENDEKVDVLSMINLHAVRSIDEIRDGHCRLNFSETHAITLNGNDADEFMALVYRNAITGTGISLDEILAPASDSIADLAPEA